MPLKLSGSSSSSIQPWKCLRFNPHWIPVWEITLYWMLQNLADLPNISWIVNYTSLCLGVVYYPLSFHSLWFPPQMFRSKRTSRQQLVLENDMSSCFPLCPPWNPIYPGLHEVALPQIHYPTRITIYVAECCRIHPRYWLNSYNYTINSVLWQLALYLVNNTWTRFQFHITSRSISWKDKELANTAALVLSSNWCERLCLQLLRRIKSNFGNLQIKRLRSRPVAQLIERERFCSQSSFHHNLSNSTLGFGPFPFSPAVMTWKRVSERGIGKGLANSGSIFAWWFFGQYGDRRIYFHPK